MIVNGSGNGFGCVVVRQINRLIGAAASVLDRGLDARLRSKSLAGEIAHRQ
jgi:hypothetical protein